MNDNYTHVDSNLFYVTENIMGPCDQSAEYKQLLNDFNSTYVENCSCQEICSQATCKCLQKSCGENYMAFEKDGQLKYKLQPKSMSYPLFECNDNCPCSIECGNRVVQKGPVDGLEIRKCDKGFGLFASCFFPAGTFLCEYAGEIITPNQASMRHNNNKMQGNNNYIFYLKELSGSHPVVTIIDPSIFGNIGRYINHSCEPNCQILPVRCGSLIPKLAIFACTNILANEEVTFHYGLGDNSNPETETCLTRCLCKAKSCSGFMPFQKY